MMEAVIDERIVRVRWYAMLDGTRSDGRAYISAIWSFDHGLGVGVERVRPIRLFSTYEGAFTNASGGITVVAVVRGRAESIPVHATL
jgi:hypothetical protein